MIVIAGLVIGAILGARTALKRGGSRWDAAQYGAAYAIGCSLLGLFATIFIERMF